MQADPQLDAALARVETHLAALGDALGGHGADALAGQAAELQRALAAALPLLRTPLHLLAADLDKALPPSQSQRVARLVPQASFATLPALGHLAHEEDPQQVYGHIWRLLNADPTPSPTGS